MANLEPSQTLIPKLQQQLLSTDFLDKLGDDKMQFGVVKGALQNRAAFFKLRLGEIMNQRKVVASGDLLDSINPVEIEGDNFVGLQIYVADYYDYSNEGVKGVKSSKNAPNSPYKYKHYGMPTEARARLMQYIQSGKAKIKTIERDNFKTGFEKKNLSKAETQVNTLQYLIKAYGIKTTNYFTDAFKETFADFEVAMSEAVGADIVLTLMKLNTDGNNGFKLTIG